MYKLIVNLILVCIVFASNVTQAAESSTTVPVKMPNDIPYGNSIELDRAMQIATAAANEAKKRHWKMAISIVDANGNLVYFLKMNDTQIASIQISQNKAWTAVMFRRPSEIFFQAMESGHPYVETFDHRLVASPGGNLLIEDGKIIGAIGVSGGAGAQDNIVSLAGAADLKKEEVKRNPTVE